MNSICNKKIIGLMLYMTLILFSANVIEQVLQDDQTLRNRENAINEYNIPKNSIIILSVDEPEKNQRIFLKI